MKGKLTLLFGILFMTGSVFADTKDSGNGGTTNTEPPIINPDGVPNSVSGTAVHYYVLENELFLYTVDSAMANITIYDAVTGMLLHSAYADLSDGYQAALPSGHKAIVRVIIDGQLYSCTI